MESFQTGLIFYTKMVLKWILLITTLHRTISGQSVMSAIRTTNRACSSDHQCLQSIGEVCWWFYDGCRHGRCMCDPRTHYLDDLGKCGEIKLGGEQCGQGDRCPDRMECKHDRCLCKGDMRITGDNRFCLKERERMFGETCDPVTNVCFLSMATGYHTDRVGCFSKKCRCKSGYKQEGGSCRKLYVSEGYCDQNHHCQGGAICRGKLCVCPPGYFPALGNTKCIKEGAQVDLGLGASCDEVNEKRYCAQDLVCYHCPNEAQYTCAAYRESQTYNSALIGSGVRHTPTALCVLICLLSLTFSTLNRWCSS